MVQVSYPGVYIREVPSGSRTITGVATSVAAFIGKAARGPVNEPVAILSFSDYVRVFSDSIKEGELTDQVRQFFLNGGQQAYVYRIAKDPDKAELNLAALPLVARHAGADGSKLRTRIDYKTGEPGRTFNLTIYREEINASGAGEAAAEETLGNLSMDPSSARYVKTVVNRDSALATLPDTWNSAALTTERGVSIAGKLTLGAGSYEDELETLLTDLGTARMRVTLGSESQVVAITYASGTASAAIAAAINGVFPGAGVTANVVAGTTGTLETLVISSGDTRDIKIESVPDASSDLAGRLGLGTANGGFEFGPYAAQRPTPNGLVSSLSATAAGLASLLAFAATSTSLWDDATTITLSGPNYPFSMPASNVKFGTPARILARSSSTSPYSLTNVVGNLQTIASAINALSDNKGFKAEVHGLRLVLLPTFGTAASGGSHYFSSGPTSLVAASAAIFTATQNSVQSAWLFGGGSDGTDPEPTDYADAFTNLESNVDLVNLVVLPKRADDAQETPENRKAIWANAADYCLRNRAFLIIDPDAGVTTVDDALSAVKQQRVGIVKDHSAMYWPRVQVNPDGNRRSIDPGGTIAGVMARIDDSRGVWKAPAGIEADLRGILGVDTPMSDRENGRLNPEALNCIRAFTNGIVSWGARTMDGFDNSGNDDYKYVPVRRFALFLEESLYRGLKWAVFEPNDHRLWSQIRLTVGSFMNGLYRQGAFFGEKPQDAYFVKVDSETTTPNDINLGICNVIVGFAPLKPAEFIVVTIKQKAGQVQV